MRFLLTMPQLRKLPNFSFEKKLWKKGFKFVCGVDEAGRGAWSGPVVAASVVFPSSITMKQFNNGTIKIDDSKKLKPRERELAAKWIKENALVWNVSEVGVRFINKYGIGKATARAMRRAIGSVLHGSIASLSHCFILVDGFHVKYLTGGLKNQKSIVHGDQKSISIASASILAKVHRDAVMRHLARKKRYKVYGWGRNKGYGTKLQQKAILRYGLIRLHRRKFVRSWADRRGYIF